VAAVLIVLTGCAEQQPPALHPAAEQTDVPVMSQPQVDRVMNEVAVVVAAADKAGDAKLLAPRADGVEAQLRQSRYLIRTKQPKYPAPSPVGTKRLVDAIPVDQPWPRFMFSVTEPTPDAVPRLQLLTQQNARVPFRLSASATLLPGVTLPRTAAPATGVDAVAIGDQAGLKLSPVQAVGQYADVLTASSGSKYANAFSDDAFRKAVNGEQDAERKAATETCQGCFDYKVVHTPRQNWVWAIRTLDGGALVLGVVDTTRTFTVKKEGSKLPLTPELAALSGKQEATKSAAITSVEVVAMHVPAADSKQPVQVVAADRGPVKATAS
jgi:hypothetical protein